MPAWLKDSVFYEIYPQSFFDSNGDGIGDINGIYEKLEYIKSLGFNAIWINPCFDSPFMDAGYDVRDYYMVAPRYGTNDDLKKLFEKAHSMDMRILLDLVPGHTSNSHPWFEQSKKPEKNEYSNRYIWTNSAWEAPPSYRLECGITDRDGNYLVNFFSSQPALNYGFYEITHPDWQMSYKSDECKKTVEEIKNIMRFWLDMGCDGFRVDMADSLVKNDDEKIATAEIWKDIRAMLDEYYPEAVLVSEWCCPKRSLNCGFHADFYLDHKGNGYNIAFRSGDSKSNNNSFFSKNGDGDITPLVNELISDIANTKGKGYVSFITGNHDVKRISHLYDETELKIAYCTLFLLPGVPFLYYGDEIGMRYIDSLTSKEGGFHRTGSRTPMQWNDGKNLGFSETDCDKLYLPVDNSKDAPTVLSQLNNENSLLNTVKNIIAIRRSTSDFSADGDFEALYAEKNKYPFIFKRGNHIVCVNPSQRTEAVNINVDIESELFMIGNVNYDNGIMTTQPQSFAVYKLK